MERGPSRGDSFIPQSADYVKFSRYAFNSTGGAQYFNVPDNASKSNKTLITSAYIAMPNNLSVDYGAAYNQSNLGALGRAATGALAGRDGAEVAAALQQAAEAGLPESAFNNLAQGIQGVGGLLGLNTGGSDANTLMAVSQGKVLNPYSEQVFNGVGFRQFTFDFKMVATSEKEAATIQEILEMFKVGMLPAYSGGDSGQGGSLGGLLSESAAAQRFLSVPDKFLIEFKRINEGSLQAESLVHFKVDFCVLTGMSVNYTPDGQYVAIKSERLRRKYRNANKKLSNGSNKNVVSGQAPNVIFVPAVQINLSFTETSIVTQEKALVGY